MAIDKLVLLRARPSPEEGDPPLGARPLGRSAAPPGSGAEEQDSAVGPPQGQAGDTGDQEARGGEEHPVGAHPED